MHLKNVAVRAAFAGLAASASVVSAAPLVPAPEASIVAPVAGRRPSDWVKCEIDTVKPRWFYFNSACRPFGMVNLSPDTQVKGDWDAGYRYDDKAILCFSHIHSWQLAGIPVMPTVGPVKGHLGFEATKSAFSHERETIRPGYHKVVLDDYGVTAELTSTLRVGFHRYTFPKTGEANILLPVGHDIGMCPVPSATLRRVGDRGLEGESVLGPTGRRKKPCTVWFAVEFDRPFRSFTAWRDTGVKSKTNDVRLVSGAVDAVEGARAGGAVTFAFDAPGAVLVKVAHSYVSAEQARLNLTAELPHWDFDRVVEESRAEWDAWLGRIRVEGGTEAQRVKFYTDLWHALLGRRTFSDANGKYVDRTGDKPVVRQVPLDAAGGPLRNTYNSDSLWGSHWTLNPLWALAYPRVLNDFCASFLDYFDNGGMMARGPSGGDYTFVMIGDPATPMVAAAVHAGIRDFDVDKAFAAALTNAFVGGIRDHAGYETGRNARGGGMHYYVERGYVPLHKEGSGGHREGAAQTLEYAYQDWCIAQLAETLGRDKEREFFAKRARNYRKLFDQESGWMRPREIDGSFQKDFEPVRDSNFNVRGFVESTAAIYTWFAPQDLPDLFELMGGREAAVRKLAAQFEKAAPERFIVPHGKHGSAWVDYENQPSCHMAHLFSHMGAPWLSQYWVRRVKEETFGDITPRGGYNGDEDEGQMGALGVLMGAGLFAMQGGAERQPRFDLTAPVFDRVTVALDPRYHKGGAFSIVAKNQGPNNIYIQSARLNGKPIDGRFWITLDEIKAGGTLELDLGPAPNKAWGVAK